MLYLRTNYPYGSKATSTLGEPQNFSLKTITMSKIILFTKENKIESLQKSNHVNNDCS